MATVQTSQLQVGIVGAGPGSNFIECFNAHPETRVVAL